MCDDFHIKIGHDDGEECGEDSNISYFIDSAENIVVDGMRGIYYFQQGLNLYGNEPGPGNCAVNLNNQDWSSLGTDGPATEFKVRYNDESMLSVNFLNSGGDLLGFEAKNICDPLAEETLSYALQGDHFSSWFYLYPDNTRCNETRTKTVSGGMWGQDEYGDYTEAHDIDDAGSFCYIETLFYDLSKTVTWLGTQQN